MSTDSPIQVRTMASIPVPMPRQRILGRLGYNRHRTLLQPRHRALVDAAVELGFRLCRPRGAWARVPIEDRTESGLRLATGLEIESASLAKLLAQSGEALLMAVTVGEEVVEAARDAIEAENGVRAAVFDAVGGQTADAALQWLQDYIERQLPREGRRLTRHRFSPGYGDLRLTVQRDVFSLLRLDDLGLSLTERFLLIPEKSVIGIAGIERAGGG